MALPQADWRSAGPTGMASVGHDPSAWKYHHLGNYLLNGALPPDRGQI
jgi:hypothetical protein